ncbi:hypothetical protein DUNSADRAFT_1763 [Dunaliella salina]|uniref:EF-hand domain-containing protein n=1 Tax=Dunaliella salina TaxID=3046 RepID=A0ABQ7FX23_DUNSA|nr:hypothetical protein DUNSADRAFT_1763 [Dunaliella salina]|eukprot:KAF5826912.1 hypothetical protein DUNSADRAFT_1763 [Dunaliella salina]
MQSIRSGSNLCIERQAALYQVVYCKPLARPVPCGRPHLYSGLGKSGVKPTSFGAPTFARAKGSKYLCRAEPENEEEGFSLKKATSVLWEANSAWGKYAGRSGDDELTLEEATDILNGPELRQVALTLFNVEPAHRTPEELEDKFKQADSDKSGRLSRVEFLALYLSVVTGRVQTSPGVLAEALLGFIDVDRNGRIEGGELKVLLTLLGFPMAAFLPIPKSVGVDYRSWLSKVNGSEPKE